MGVFIDYTFHAECPEEEMLDRMNRLRAQLVTLPFDSVSPVLPVDPAYLALPLKKLVRSGYTFPPEVARALDGKLGTPHDDLCFMAVPLDFGPVPRDLVKKFYQPAVRFAETTTLWQADDLPEELGSPSLSFSRSAFVYEMTAALRRRGHLIVVRPCEGCEPFAIGLTHFQTEGTPCWLGCGFTKTQYATRFVEAHAGICRGLDFAREAGLLLEAQDTCGFYAHRDWSKSAAVVNAETTAAHVFGGLLSRAVQDARAKGAPIEEIHNPATRTFNLIRVEEEERKD